MQVPLDKKEFLDMLKEKLMEDWLILGGDIHCILRLGETAYTDEELRKGYFSLVVAQNNNANIVFALAKKNEKLEKMVKGDDDIDFENTIYLELHAVDGTTGGCLARGITANKKKEEAIEDFIKIMDETVDELLQKLSQRGKSEERDDYLHI